MASSIESMTVRFQLPFWAPWLMRIAVWAACMSRSERLARWLGCRVGRLIAHASLSVAREL